MSHDWNSAMFEDCIEDVSYTRKVQRSEFLDDGAFPVVSQEESFINGYWNDADDVFRITKPLVVFGDHTKVLKFIDFDFVLGADGVKLLQPRDFLFPRFFYYQLLSVELKSLGYARHYRLLKALRIRYPALSEQRRIVGILDEAFDGVAAVRADTQASLQRAQGLFEVAFGSLVNAPEGRAWPLTSVAELAQAGRGAIRTGPFGSQLLHSEFVDEGIAVLGIDNVVANEFRWGKSRFITDEKFGQLHRYRVWPGDVLITIMGTCGRCAVVPDDIPIAINTKHLCCITLDRGKCLPGYLQAYFLHHPVAREYLAARAKGAIMEGLNMGIIQELPVLLPSLERQHQIVTQLAELHRRVGLLESGYVRKLAALDELKRSLLHQAFTGQLTERALATV